jgi:GT2 family glycosyltransferase
MPAESEPSVENSVARGVRIFIGIPVLNRLDLLRKCIAAIDYPAEVLVVSNNAVDQGFIQEVDHMATELGFAVLHQRRNLGVAASWNLILRTAFNQGYDWAFIGSNDTIVHPGSLKAAVDFQKDKNSRVWHLSAWNLFLVNRRAIDDIGWFDENFYPAYKEDQDYSYRCRLAGRDRVNVPCVSADHIGSATIRSDARYARRNRRTHALNLSHYVTKWGGDATKERFTRPYDRPDRDHRWWPDPGGSILTRDWTLASYDEHSTLPFLSLRGLYDRAAKTPSDIWEHVPALRRFAGAARHITALGTARGMATSAFLSARPHRLVTYDARRSSELGRHQYAARAWDIQFEWIRADVPRQLIEDTDLLFIDLLHAPGRLRTGLRVAGRVRNLIILHGTEIFAMECGAPVGNRDTRGIPSPIGAFLRGDRSWVLHRVSRNNNGLIVLKRRQ